MRPLTAKWHRAFEDGRLNGRDGADEFCGELEGAQKKLRSSRRSFTRGHRQGEEDALTPPVMSAADLQALFAP